MISNGVTVGELIQQSGRRAGADISLPVFSVTKHRGFVLSLEYFKKQVFGRELSSYKVVNKGEFAYATIHLDEGSIGLAPNDGLVSPMYTVFSIDESRVNAGYLIRVLKCPEALGQYAQMGNGSAERRKSISIESFGRMKISLPPLPEQRRIAAILDQADALRTKRRHALTLLDELADAEFRSLFDDALPLKTIALSSLCTKITDGTHQSPGWTATGIPFLFISNVVSGKIVYETTKYVSEDSYRELTKHSPIELGDVLYTAVGSYGVPAVVTDSRPFIFQRHIAHIKPNPSLINSEYLRTALASEFVRHQADRVARGAAQKTVTLGELSKFQIPMVAFSIQTSFAKKMGRLSAMRLNLQIEVDQLDELFASLQHRAFRGEL